MTCGAWRRRYGWAVPRHRRERAHLALRAAGETVPEEITGRPAARRLLRDLMTTAPRSVQRQAGDFAHRIGVTE
jgi:hypothetical protein